MELECSASLADAEEAHCHFHCKPGHRRESMSCSAAQSPMHHFVTCSIVIKSSIYLLYNTIATVGFAYHQVLRGAQRVPCCLTGGTLQRPLRYRELFGRIQDLTRTYGWQHSVFFVTTSAANI